MKKVSASLALMCCLVFSGANFGVADLGFDVNYLGISTTNTDSGGTTTSSNGGASGYLFTFYFHASFPLGSLFSIGVGPYAGIGVGSPKNPGSGYTFDRGSIFRVGGDVMLTADFVPIVKPFVRGMVGSESIDEWQNFTIGSNQYQTRIAINGFSYNVLGGVQFPLGTNFSIYAQAGLTGSGKRNVTPVSGTVNGSAFTYTITGDPQLSYTGLIAGAGIILRF